MVESHQQPLTAHLWRFALTIFKELSTSTNDYQLAVLIR
jgi:hypothetical protein